MDDHQFPFTVAFLRRTVMPSTYLSLHYHLVFSTKNRMHQEEHNRKKSYREELIEFLEMAGVQHDPQHLD
jgi:hypothetical protein